MHAHTYSRAVVTTVISLILASFDCVYKTTHCCGAGARARRLDGLTCACARGDTGDDDGDDADVDVDVIDIIDDDGGVDDDGGGGERLL
jgi:hypothetical protein